MTGLDRVVVTGLGVVDANGWGAAEAVRACANPDPKPVEIDRTAGYHRKRGAHRGLMVDAAPQKRWLSPLAARRMSAASRYAVCASKMAIESAELGPEVPWNRTAVVIATAYGAADISERILRQNFLDGPRSISPALFTESVANAPAAQIALAAEARGANITVTQRQAGPPVALARSLMELRSGRADRVLVGAVDELTPLLHAILDRCRALALPDSRGIEIGRPFDANRNGWMASEGAAVAVLELESFAEERGAPILAQIIASGSAFDPESPRSGWGRESKTLVASLGDFLEKAGCNPSEIDLVVSGASGHHGADRLEGHLLNAVWKKGQMPPILTPAATSGSHGGALLAGAILAANGRAFGPTPGFLTADPDIRITPHDGSELEPPRRVLLSVCAAGGSAGWAILGSANI